jgi:hypothetical protein
MPVSTQTGAALTVASVVGGVITAAVALLLNAKPVRQVPPPAAAEVAAEAHRCALAEDAIQRTLEGRSF